MNRLAELGRNLWQVVLPTPLQAAAVLVLSFWFLTLANLSPIMTKVGITSEGVDSGRTQAVAALNSLFGPQLLANIALVLFWAGVGFAVYLICWSVYNTMIKLRNRVTLETGYRNRGSSIATVLPMVFNSLSAVALIMYVFTLAGGFSQWLSGSQALVQIISPASLLLALLAMLGLAAQLYLLVVLVQLTLTPWYGRAFTN